MLELHERRKKMVRYGAVAVAVCGTVRTRDLASHIKCIFGSLDKQQRDECIGKLQQPSRGLFVEGEWHARAQEQCQVSNVKQTCGHGYSRDNGTC